MSAPNIRADLKRLREHEVMWPSEPPVCLVGPSVYADLLARGYITADGWLTDTGYESIGNAFIEQMKANGMWQEAMEILGADDRNESPAEA